MISATFACVMIAPGYVHDGDTIRCADGTRIRIAGIQAPDFEDTEPCRAGRADYVCSNAQANRSQAIVQRLVWQQTLSCLPVGRSYARVVARCRLPDGRDLSCAAIAAGAATRWERYWRSYRMGACTR